MRQRYALTVTLVVVSLLLLALRNHIRDLSEIARTYATFSSMELERFTYPPTEDQAAAHAESPQLAPKILHQIILSEGRNTTFAKYDTARQSCISMHPDWTHNLWTDSNATAFVREHYPEVFPHYVLYEQTIQRTNILRYLLLHHFGGVYLDVDITCRVPLDSLLHLPWVTPAAYPAGINNAFILARAQHPFLTEELIAKIPSHDLSWPLPYVENMLTTGCMFFTNAWMSYMRRRDLRAEDKVYVLADSDGGLESQMLRGKVTTSLFEHGGASSWHGWDAAAIVLVGEHYCVVLMGLGVLVMAVVGAGAWYVRRPKLGRRKSWHDEEKLFEDIE